MNTNTKKNTVVIVAATATAAAAGYVAGLLLAPRTGKQTRKMIDAKTKRAEKQIIKTAKTAQKDVVKTTQSARQTVAKNVDKAETAAKASLQGVVTRLRPTSVAPAAVKATAKPAAKAKSNSRKTK